MDSNEDGAGRPGRMGDAEVLERAAAANGAALDEVVRRHGRSAWQLAVVASGSATAATDIAARGLSLSIAAAGSRIAEDADQPPHPLTVHPRSEAGRQSTVGPPGALSVHPRPEAGRQSTVGPPGTLSGQRPSETGRHSTVRPLVLRSVRRCALEARIGDSDDLNGVVAHQPGADREPVVRVFAELPETWRSALWLATMERLSPDELTAALDLDAHDTHLLLSRVLKAVDRRAAAWGPPDDGASEADGAPLAPATVGAALAALALAPPAGLEAAILSIWATHRSAATTSESDSAAASEAALVDVADAKMSRRARLLARATRTGPQAPAGAAVMVLVLGALAVFGTGGTTGSGPVIEPIGGDPGAIPAGSGANGGGEADDRGTGRTRASAPGDDAVADPVMVANSGPSGAIESPDARSGTAGATTGGGGRVEGLDGGGTNSGPVATSLSAPVAPTAPGSSVSEPPVPDSAGPGQSQGGPSEPSAQLESSGRPSGPGPVTGPSLQTTLPAPPATPPATARPPTTRSPNPPPSSPTQPPPTTAAPTTPVPTVPLPTVPLPTVPLPSVDDGLAPVDDRVCGPVPCP